MIFIDDLIHKDLTLPDYAKDIIDSLHFKRLKKLKQLGVSHHIFKRAVHTRYEHSIGTAFLCERLLKCIELNSGIKIAEIHKKCVILAGLLHDLGHGPFSHLWEHCVHQASKSNQDWTHESQSEAMIKDMIVSNGIKLHADVEMHEYALELISSLITGDCEAWQRLLKPSEMYLTEIVSNKYCNIDVDKLDYLLRDYYYVHRKIESFEDFFKRARVVSEENGITHIAYHVDDFKLIENMFTNRAIYHNEVYQLADVSGIERHLQDICVLADHGGLEIGGLSISKLQNDCRLYLQLDDSVLNLIRNSSLDNQCMKMAKKLLQHFDEGDFYKFVYESHDSNDITSTYEDLVSKFGDIFCKVDKKIPNANIPKNIPLYDDSGATVRKISNRNLSYESVLIFSKAFDDEIYHNILNYLNNNNNL